MHNHLNVVKNLQHKVCIFFAKTVKENVQLLLYKSLALKECVAVSINILMFFDERAPDSEKILTTASEIS